jgi:hypothetical protein
VTARAIALTTIAAVAGIALLVALSGTQATAQTRRSRPEPAWICYSRPGDTGGVCELTPGTCEELRADSRAAGFRPPSCWRQSFAWCAQARYVDDPPEGMGLWCAPTRAACDAAMRELEARNRYAERLGMRPAWQDIGECSRIDERSFAARRRARADADRAESGGAESPRARSARAVQDRKR